MAKARRKRKTRLTEKDDIIITLEARQIVKFIRWVWSLKGRRHRRKANEEIERDRLEHITGEHRRCQCKRGAK